MLSVLLSLEKHVVGKIVGRTGNAWIGNTIASRRWCSSSSTTIVALLLERIGRTSGGTVRIEPWRHATSRTSYTYRTPVSEMIGERLWISLPLALMALAISTLIAFPVGIIAASNRGSLTDTIVMGLTQLGVAIPNFWFAMLMVLVFAINLRWFSAGGFPGWEDGFLPGLKALTLPAISLALPQASILARVMRSALVDTLNEDFMRTARAKGLSRKQAIRSHALRNAMIPVLTIIGLQFSFLLAGAIIIENVFFLPGLGRLVFQAISQRDLIVVESVVMLLVFAVIIVNFAVDIAYAAVDPRLRRRT